jgi:hypothetical protein
MRRNNYPLRLQPSLMEEARKVAEVEGVTLNQLFNVAVAEKLAVLRTEKHFQERLRLAERAEAPRIPDGAAKGNPRPPDRAPGGESTLKVFGWANPQVGQLKRHLDKIRRRWI